MGAAMYEDLEFAARHLRRRISETRDRLEAAEPGSDDFRRAHQESMRLMSRYRELRSLLIPGDSPRGSAGSGAVGETEKAKR